MRRFRRNRGTWLPLDPTILAETQDAVTTFTTDVTPSPNVGERGTLSVVPVAFDLTRQTPNNVGGDVTMRDLTEGQDYFLDRIVGKVFAELGAADANSSRTVQCCMAFAILPVEDDGTTVSGVDDDFDPLLTKNTMAPYIWRRTWRLFNHEENRALPAATEQFGSVMDGGHMDAKTKRRVRQNERLFCLFQTLQLETVGIPDPGNVVTFGFDLRLHGALRRNRNRSLFR